MKAIYPELRLRLLRSIDRATAVRWLGWLALVGAALLLAASDLAMVAAAPEYFREAEELANATVARELLLTAGTPLLEFQHTPYCGGCTAISLLTTTSFAIAGVHYLAFKAVPAVLAAAMLLLGFRLLARTSGRPAACAWAVLWCCAPAVVAQSTLMAWGNHYEVMLLVLVQGLATVAILRPTVGGAGQSRRPWWVLGLGGGLGFWFCYSSVFALPALCLLAMWGVGLRQTLLRVPYLLVGFSVGLVPLAVYTLSVEADPFMVLTAAPGREAGAWLTQLGDVGLVGYARTLHFVPWAPAPAWWSLATLGTLWLAVASGLMAARAVVRRDRAYRALPALLMAASAGLYATSPFRAVVPVPGALPSPMDVRYLVPAMVLSLLLAAAGLGRLWASSSWGRIVAGAMLLAIALPGAWTRWTWMQGAEGGPDAADVPPFHYRMLVDDQGRHMPEEAWLARSPEDPISRVNHPLEPVPWTPA